MKPKHIPQRWPSMKERFSCGCCKYFRPGERWPCGFYSSCKGLPHYENGKQPKNWLYDEETEMLTKAMDTERDRQRGLAHGTEALLDA